MTSLKRSLHAAAEAIASAEVILIGAGAGMSVDSALPDFRGSDGLWNVEVPVNSQGLTWREISSPRGFRRHPELAWGFYGTRLAAFRQSVPHRGYEILCNWAMERAELAFVFTSNVDGQFQKAGFSADNIYECHGSVHYLQCRGECPGRVFSADSVELEVDPTTLLAKGPLPKCDRCGLDARPNVLMFYDNTWVSKRYDRQYGRYQKWLAALHGKAVVIEVGAGTAIPSVRAECEAFAEEFDATLIRINPSEPRCHDGISIRLPGLDALQRIDRLMHKGLVLN